MRNAECAPPRGREDIFLDDVDRQELLETLAEACQKTGWQVHAYRENHSGELHRETAEQKAQRIIAQELARTGWEEPDLACGPKNDPRKLAVATRLRKETTHPAHNSNSNLWFAPFSERFGKKESHPHSERRARGQLPRNEGAGSKTLRLGNLLRSQSNHQQGVAVVHSVGVAFRSGRQYHLYASTKFLITPCPF